MPATRALPIPQCADIVLLPFPGFVACAREREMVEAGVEAGV